MIDDLTKQRAVISNQVYRAVKCGKLVRGECAHLSPHCKGNIVAHHEDYSKPYDVVWLCVRHHCWLHAERRAEARAA